MAAIPPGHPPRPAFTLIELLVVLGIIGLLVGLISAAVQAARQAAARADCQNRLRQIGLAAHQYHDAHRQLPPGTLTRGDGPLYMSWLTRLLPYLEQPALFDQAGRDYSRQPLFDRPLDGHANLASPVVAFTCPLADRQTGLASYLSVRDEPFPVAFTWYQGVSGGNSVNPDGVLYANSRTRFADITDGQSHTLLVGERPPSPDNRLGWWYAGVGQRTMGNSADYFLGLREYPDPTRLPMCVWETGSFRPGRLDEMCDVIHFWSLHPGGANFAFCDGSVRFLRYSADAVLPALATRAGGEVVPGDY